MGLHLLPLVGLGAALLLVPLVAQNRPCYVCEHGKDLRLTFVRGQEFVVTSPGGFQMGRLTDFDDGVLEALGAQTFRACKPGQARFAWTYFTLADRKQERPLRVTVTVEVKNWGEEPFEFDGTAGTDVAVGAGETFRIRMPSGSAHAIRGVEPGPGIEVVEVERLPVVKGVRRVTLRATEAGQRRIEWVLRDLDGDGPRKLRQPIFVSSVAGGNLYQARAVLVYAQRDYMPGNENAGKLRARAGLLLRNPGSESRKLRIEAMDVITPAGRRRVPLGREITLEADSERRIPVGYPEAGEIDLDGDHVRLEIEIRDEQGHADTVRTWRVPVQKTS